MTRQALILYVPNSRVGSLPGTIRDYENLCNFLKSDLGGSWRANEITALPNPLMTPIGNGSKFYPFAVKNIASRLPLIVGTKKQDWSGQIQPNIRP